MTLRVVVFHWRQISTCPAPLKSSHKVGPESSSTGSSFFADHHKPVPLAAVSQDSRWEQCELRQSIHARHLSDDKAFGYLKRVVS